MAAGAWILTTNARTKKNDGTFDFDSDTFKMALFLSTSNLSTSSTTFAGVTNEHDDEDTGYTAGGEAITLTISGTTTVKITFTDPVVWTADSAGLEARWACIYEVGGDVVCFCLLDATNADVSVTDGNTLTITANEDGVFSEADA